MSEKKEHYMLIGIPIIISTLEERIKRYSTDRRKLWRVFLLPFAFALIFVFVQKNPGAATIVAALIALFGTTMAYVDSYYRKEIDITLNKIEAVKGAKRILETRPGIEDIKEECFEKLDLLLQS